MLDLEQTRSQMAPGSTVSGAPFDTRMLEVGDGHELYVEQFGKPDGIPAVFLHGGPGSGSQPHHRSLFDPERFRAVLFDQRGAGRSRPRRERAANTTAHLVADVETIRETLGISRWLVVGGSWGATLALAYAERFPDRVAGLALRSVFLGTRAELDAIFTVTLPRFRPDLHAQFVSILPEAERMDSLPAYWRRILDPDPAVHEVPIRVWHDVERILSQLRPGTPVLPPDRLHAASAAPLPSTPFFEAHFFQNGCFLKDGQLLADAGRLADIPGVIVQGRYDLLCPPAVSAALAARWPRARIKMVEAAGHDFSDPGIMAAFKSAIDEVAGLTRPADSSRCA
jgi:proline iminopeptidase